MAVQNVLILALSGQGLAAPLLQEKPDFVTDAEMELAGQKLEAYLARVDAGMATAEDPSEFTDTIFRGYPALNFAEVTDASCGGNGRRWNLAAAFSDLRALQINVRTETYRGLPNTTTEAWDWFFMKDQVENPEMWSRNPNTFRAWRAIPGKEILTLWLKLSCCG